MGEEVEVVDVPDANRYEARIGGEPAGFAQYVRSPTVVAFLHTEVDPAYEGRGVGSALARAGLDAERAAGHQVVPVCPFVAGWIRKHPEYQALVYDEESAVSD
ncbi:GNAT family N-acetyltransferase [Streptomyces xiaopingdaonensis]|uniref:GNAT family N-acetyltransferase n=1 Tax=Streptomyces xiaopingdaonensis TaxID=1565415 RepID=UPI00030D8768|nr:GNAT family N-acetyltransferase [Streptomyces xiaopingdaonensis]